MQSPAAVPSRSDSSSASYHVLFVIDIATRCVCIGGITSDPNGEWMKQAARNLTDMWDGFLLGKRYLIHETGTRYSPRRYVGC